MENSPGMHHLQKYCHPSEPAIVYLIEHNLTYFWIRLNGALIAEAKFRLINNERPGDDFTHEKAIEVINSLYNEVEPAFDATLHLTFNVFFSAWYDARKKTKQA